MFYLFDVNYADNGTYQSRRIPAMRNSLFKNVNRELKRVKGYLRNRDKFVHSNHIFLKTLRTFNIDPTLELFEYHDKVIKNVEDVAKANGINTMLNTPMSTSKMSHLYGQDVTEVYLMINNKVDLMTIEDDWESKPSVKVLRHDVTNIDLTPMGKDYDGGFGYAVLKVDLVLMMHQYRLWYLKQLRSKADFLKPTTAFISNHVISNMLDSHFNMAMFNRLVALYRGVDVWETKTKIPFPTANFTRQMDKYLFKLIGILNCRRMYYGEYLKQIALLDVDLDQESLNTTSALDLAMLPNVITSRQTTWIYVLARIPFLSFMLELDYDLGGRKNRRDANIIKRFFTRSKNSRLFEGKLGNIDSRALQQDINEMVLRHL